MGFRGQPLLTLLALALVAVGATSVAVGIERAVSGSTANVAQHQGAARLSTGASPSPTPAAGATPSPGSPAPAVSSSPTASPSPTHSSGAGTASSSGGSASGPAGLPFTGPYPPVPIVATGLVLLAAGGWLTVAGGLRR